METGFSNYDNNKIQLSKRFDRITAFHVLGNLLCVLLETQKNSKVENEVI